LDAREGLNRAVSARSDHLSRKFERKVEKERSKGMPIGEKVPLKKKGGSPWRPETRRILCF